MDVKYVAVDGEEFESKADCRLYESKLESLQDNQKVYLAIFHFNDNSHKWEFKDLIGLDSTKTALEDVIMETLLKYNITIKEIAMYISEHAFDIPFAVDLDDTMFREFEDLNNLISYGCRKKLQTLSLREISYRLAHYWDKPQITYHWKMIKKWR